MDVTTACEPVVDDHDGYYRRDEGQIRAEEGKEVLGAVDQEPGDDGPDKDMAEDHAADNGEVLGEETVEIAADWYSVARYVGDDCGEALDEGSEEDECTSSWAPELVEDQAVEVPQIPICYTEMLYSAEMLISRCC